MDKVKVFDAYRRGYITVKECGQILGVEEAQLLQLLRQEEARNPYKLHDRVIGS
ncbi:hypothetical protein D3C81_430750 [compost metagenome]|uniref:hypothetical protein n=1 Tax=Paenibacillus stellifer TaxID=169760 RepID=UPI000A813C8C|nr:hypothetical protein [Paenibacillus stellifer]